VSERLKKSSTSTSLVSELGPALGEAEVWEKSWEQYRASDQAGAALGE
jgi:hypothetical protein